MRNAPACRSPRSERYSSTKSLLSARPRASRQRGLDFKLPVAQLLCSYAEFTFDAVSSYISSVAALYYVDVENEARVDQSGRNFSGLTQLLVAARGDAYSDCVERLPRLCTPMNFHFFFSFTLPSEEIVNRDNTPIVVIALQQLRSSGQPSCVGRWPTASSRTTSQQELPVVVSLLPHPTPLFDRN